MSCATDTSALQDVFFFLRLVFNNRTDESTLDLPSALDLLEEDETALSYTVASVIKASLDKDDWDLHENLLQILFPYRCTTQSYDKFNGFSLLLASPPTPAVTEFHHIAFASRICELVGRLDYPKRYANIVCDGVLGLARMDGWLARLLDVGLLDKFCEVLITSNPQEPYQNTEGDRRNRMVRTFPKLIRIMLESDVDPKILEDSMRRAVVILDRWMETWRTTMEGREAKLEEDMHQVNDEKVKAIVELLRREASARA